MMPPSQDDAAALFCSRRLREETPSADRLLGRLESLDGYGLETDALKITLSAPVRRLQLKTQVFPLDVKATSRSRLTHSLEVQTYARIISLALLRENPSFETYREPWLRSVANAAWLHDLGNPPFGHFGESVIRKWLRSVVAEPRIGDELHDAEKEDLCAFNGNAQSLRVAHSIERLNLTLGQYASFVKVPYLVTELLSGRGRSGCEVSGDFYAWSHAHAGVFLSEMPLLTEIRLARGTDLRHPFSRVIEWADDLSYILADMEDAFERRLINRYDILHMCDKLVKMPELEPLHEPLSHRKVADVFIYEPALALMYLRDVLSEAYISDITAAVKADPDRFLATGSPDLTASPGTGRMVMEMLRDYERKNIYPNSEIEALELTGGSYLDGILSEYKPLLCEEVGRFQRELSGSGGDPWLRRLACRIGRTHREAYFRAVAFKEHGEMYARVRLLTDYVAGMTDTLAEAEYRIITGAARLN